MIQVNFKNLKLFNQVSNFAIPAAELDESLTPLLEIIWEKQAYKDFRQILLYIRSIFEYCIFVAYIIIAFSNGEIFKRFRTSREDFFKLFKLENTFIPMANNFFTKRKQKNLLWMRETFWHRYFKKYLDWRFGQKNLKNIAIGKGYKYYLFFYQQEFKMMTSFF